MQDAFDRTINPATLGSGRDQVHKMQYSGLKVSSVFRIESPELWKRFIAQRSLMVSQLRQQQVGFIEAETTFFQPSTHPQCNRGVNEIFLYHGFKSEFLETIMAYGLDERVGSLGGLFGAGVYFADMISKSDQYVVPNTAGKYSVLVARVCLGAAFKPTGRMGQTRRAPVMPDAPGLSPGRPFDSIAYDQTCPSLTGDSSQKHYSEFIVYDSAQTYPEFLVEFERV